MRLLEQAGKRPYGTAKRADYVLYHRPNLPIAIIKAKDNTHSIGAGLQQALEYADILGIPFVFASNGDGFAFHDPTGMAAIREQTLALDAFPTSAELWARYAAWKGLTPEAERVILQGCHDDGSGKEPRHYQVNAVNAAVEAIAKGQDRVLLCSSPERLRVQKRMVLKAGYSLVEEC